MIKVMADVLKNEGSSYPDKMEAETNYHVGQKLYFEYGYNESIYRDTTGVAEFEVTGIVLNTFINPHETMLEVKTEDEEYKKRLPEANQQFLLFEADIERYLAKNTELLNEMRGQMVQSLYTTGTRYANVELDNGRHIAINEIKDDKGNFKNRYKVSLYANSDEIQAGIFKGTNHVLRLYEGTDSVDFLYQSLKTALQVNENIKTPEYYQELEVEKKNIEQDNTVLSSPVVKLLDDQSSVIISNNSGESIKLNMMEFWEIVRFGEEMDTRDEIETYLSDCDLIGNIPVSLIIDNEKALKLLTERVISNRVNDQSGDDIYDALMEMNYSLSEVILDDLLEEIDCFIDPNEVYYDIPGSELSQLDAKNVIKEYILNHTFDSEDTFSDMVYHAIYECQDTLKEVVKQNKDISLDDKLEAAENSKDKIEQPQKDSIDLER